MLRQRIVTAAVLIALLVAALVWLPLPGLFVVFLIVALAAAWEWSRLAGLTATAQRGGYVLLLGLLGALMWPIHTISLPAAAILATAVLWWVYCLQLLRGFPRSLADDVFGLRARLMAGALMILPVVLALVLLMAHENGLILLGLLMLIVWGADIGAYFTGRAWGRNKLAPQVSPGKTWEGALGGAVAASIIVVPLGLWQLDLDAARAMLFVLLVLLCIAASIIGDLVESAFKRSAGIKDSGTLLPGHGGVLDRIDSLLTVAPLFALGMMWLI